MSTPSEKLHKAFDSSTTNGKLITLNEEQASEFIDLVRNESKVLTAARVEKMSKPIKTVAKLVDAGDFLKPSTGRSLTEVDAYEFGSDTIELVSKEVTGNFIVFDQDIDDNVEGANLTGKLLNVVTKKIANELEVAGILGIKKTSPLRLLDMFDGFRKRVADNGNVIDAASSALFGSDVRTIAKAKFTKAFKALPTKYRTEGLAFFAGSDTVIDFNDLFDANYNRENMIGKVLGKPLIEVPLMPTDYPVPTSTASTTTASATSLKGQKVLTVASSAGFSAGQTVVIAIGTAYQQVGEVASTGSGTVTLVANLEYDVPVSQTVSTSALDGTDVLLTDPRNLIYGIQTQDMAFETERIPNKGFRYYYKARIDFQVEVPEAAVLLKNLKNS